jgi:hypothetical protein
MKEPTRLVESHPSELARAVLRSAQGDLAPGAALERTLAKVALASGAAAAATPAAARLGATALSKWVAIAGLAVVVASMSFGYRDPREAAQEGGVRGVSSPPSMADSVAPTVVAPPSPAVAVEPASSAEPVKAAASAAASPTRASPAAASRGAPAASLDDQIAALDRARNALASGDAAGALRGVDAYDRDYPGGAFAQEAMALRIEALARGGNLVRARALAARFLAANPKTPYAQRIRAVVGEPTNP